MHGQHESQSSQSLLTSPPRKQPLRSIPIFTSTSGKTYRRLPEPRRLSLLEFGHQFRRQCEEKKQVDEAALLQEDLRWRRLENSAKAANLDLRDREQEEGCRNSTLFQLASAQVASASSILAKEAAKRSPLPTDDDEVEPHGVVSAEAATGSAFTQLGSALNLSMASLPEVSCSQQPLSFATASSTKATTRRGCVRRVRSACSSYQRGPNQVSSMQYCAPVSTVALEKERPQKLHAISHARQEILSIGVVEDKVVQLFKGDVNMQGLLDLCEDAARVHHVDADEGGFMQQLAMAVGARPSIVQVKSKAASVRAVTPPTSTRSIEQAITPTAHHAMIRGDHRVPVGREVHRVFRKMQERSIQQSALSFDHVQTSKRFAQKKMEDVISQYEHELRETIRTELVKLESELSGTCSKLATSL